MTGPDPREHLERLALDCIHCGLCLPACPTYGELGTEPDSPRGRIALVRAMLEGRVDPAGPASAHLDACLGCRACETACPSSVHYGELLEAARAHLVEPARAFGLRRAFWRPVVRRVLSNRRAFALAVAPVRALRCVLRLLRVPGRALPAPVRRLLDTLPAGAPAWPAPAGPSTAPDAGPTPTGTAQRPAPGSTGAAAMLTGCVMPTLFPGANAATSRVLAAAGYRVSAPPGQGCCGALAMHDGDRAGALALARRNLESFGTFDVLVVNSAGCGAALKEYGHWFADEPALADRAAAFSARVRDVSEVLATAALPPLGPVDATVAYHDACHLAHGQGVRQAPRDLLARVPGLRLVPLAEADWCCGGAGAYTLTQPELSERLRARKLAHVRESGAQVVVTGNPSCLLQIAAGARAEGLPLQVVHTVEVLDRALGTTVPGRPGPRARAWRATRLAARIVAALTPHRRPAVPFIPAFMLKQLYRSGSLRNLPDGYAFAMTNPLMPGTINKVLKVKLDGVEVPLEAVSFTLKGVTKAATDVRDDNPVDFPRGADVEVTVTGEPLAAGSHDVYVLVETDEFGPLKVESSDHLR